MALSEDAIQAAVFEQIRLRAYPGVIAWHTPQGNKLGGKRVGRAQVPLQAIRNKKLGVLAGVSDVLALHKGEFFALELKANGNRPTEAQLEFIDRVNAAGGYAAWCEGLDRALQCLETYGLLKPNRGQS